MNFIIAGSGGCVCLPKPLCQCEICIQAREKGYPYARCGCSLYLQDISLLVDTPEDIAIALNNADIKSVDHILYSHWDPDHTLGMRIVEQLRLEWLDYYEGFKPHNPITVYAQEQVMEDIGNIRNKYGAFLDYYENVMGLIKRRVLDQPMVVKNVKITALAVPTNQAVSVFVFESLGKKLVYAPCDCIPFPDDELIHNANYLVVGNTFIGEKLKGGRIITADHPLRKELHSLEDTIELKRKFHVENVVITHLEEAWGKSFDDYKKLEKNHDGIQFAYDNMRISL